MLVLILNKIAGLAWRSNEPIMEANALAGTIIYLPAPDRCVGAPKRLEIVDQQMQVLWVKGL
jgi:hypothetical protein